ncbi:Adaptive-response sensory-kinase SasA [Terrisporobacter petrolearius]|uniref:histidine kinase n=1 Tax=Terrisporobacter petrolearius TaxID=1460447 RepID=A0ABZ3FJN7_9FIRM
MAIKLKKLNKGFGSVNFYINISSILLMVLFASLFFNTVLFIFRDNFYLFESIINNYGWYDSTGVRTFILFGPDIYYMDNRIVALAVLAICIISLIATFISFKSYKKNIKTKTFFSKYITFLYEKLTIEVPFLFVIVSIFLSANNTERQIYVYDIFVIYDAICLLLLLFLINYIIYNKNNLLNKAYFSPFIKALFNKNYKKTVNRKLAYSLCFGILVQTIIWMFIFNYIYGELIYALKFILFIDLVTFVLCIYLFRITCEKFDYVDYISKEVESIKEGSLDYKLNIKGNDQIATLANNINNMSEGLGKAVDNALKSEKMKTELIANVSHDLKTPLTSIINYVDMLKSEDIDDDTKKAYLSILDKKSKRLKTLVEEIFEAAKLSSGEMEFNIEKTDIKELLIQSIVELDDKIQESRLDFIVETPEKPIFAMIDGKRTFRAFENLIANITKYSSPNSRVYIDLFVENNTISIIFKNMSNYRLNLSPDEFLERFRRGDSSRNTEGSGLGLSITQSIVNTQNGTMDLNIDGDLFKVILQFETCK